MKKIVVTLVAIAALLTGVVAVGAQVGIQDLPGGGWWEASLVQNAGTDTASVTFTPILGYEVEGSPAAEVKTVDLNAGANVNFMPGQYGNLTMEDGFKGSAIVSSDQPIVAIGSVANNMIGDIGVTGGRAAAQYPGISQDGVAKSLLFPVVKNDYKGKTTVFYIQTVKAGEVSVTYTMGDGSTFTDSKTTEVDGQMATFVPADATGMPSSCTDNTCVGAATFTASVDMAGVYVEFNSGESPAAVLLSTRGFTPDDAGTTVYVPVVKSLWRGRTTGIQIMNAGTEAADITVDISKAGGSADAGTYTFEAVAAGSSVTFFPGNHGLFDGPFGGGAQDEFSGAMKITSAQPVVAICNENDFAGAATTKQTVFAGFSEAAGSETILFPLVKEFYNNNTTGVQIMNVGSADVTITADYVLQNDIFTVDTDAAGDAITIGAGEAFTFWGVTKYWTGDFDDSTNDFGAVTVKASAGGSIVGIAQEAENPTGSIGYLDTKNYEGFNQ